MVRKKRKELTKSANRHLSAKKQRELESKVRSLIGRNYSDLEILEELNIQPHILKQYYARIYDIDKDKFTNMTSVQVYSDFQAKSKENIKELDKLLKRFKFKHQFTATVAAVKQRHEIHKDLIKLGQQVGFIENKGNEVELETELTFATMTTEDVEKEVKNEVARLNEIANENIIEMRPELLASLGEDEDRIRKFIPANIVKEPVKRILEKKVKVKVKLRRRK